MKSIRLFETAPNGMKTDIITLTQVPNADNSGTVHIVEYQGMEFEDKMKIGQVGLILGEVSFYDTKYRGVSYKALKLLARWIEDNYEE